MQFQKFFLFWNYINSQHAWNASVEMVCQQPTGQRLNNVRTQEKNIVRANIMRKFSYHLNPKLFWFHCVRPNVHTKTYFLRLSHLLKLKLRKMLTKTKLKMTIWRIRNPKKIEKKDEKIQKRVLRPHRFHHQLNNLPLQKNQSKQKRYSNLKPRPSQFFCFKNFHFLQMQSKFIHIFFGLLLRKKL